MNREEKKIYMRKYAIEKRDAINANRRARYTTEKNRAVCAAYRAAHPDKDRERKSAHRKKNIEHYKEKRRKWVSQNMSLILAACSKRRAQKRGAQLGDIETIKAWEIGWRSKRSVKCYWCKKSVAGKNATLDHIIPLARSGAHSIENLCISCAPCNAKKQHAPLASWNKRLEQPVFL